MALNQKGPETKTRRPLRAPTDGFEGLGLDATRVRQAQVFLVPRINKGMLRRFVNRKELDAELPSAPQFL